MFRNLCLASILFTLATAASAQPQRVASADANGNLDSLIARHAAAHSVPEDLVRRVIKRESGGNPRAISKGNFGLMQIRLGTARGLGYRGTAAGLLDPDTNMTYAVKYLAGAYRVADGNANRAVHYYASGYYYAAKRKGLPTQVADSAPANVVTSVVASTDPVTPAEKLGEARAEGESVSSSSSLYSGRLDYH
jgi:soluble lytic murein transglycosylase-like protein